VISRLWQLSQQAVAGMVAGLLKQPRRWWRKGVQAMDGSLEEDPKRLKQENAELRRKLKIAEDVIALLKEFPAQRTRPHEQSEARRTSAKGATPSPSKAEVTSAAVDSTAAAAAPATAGASGEEKRGIPERVKKRSGMRSPTVPGSTPTNPELADGAGSHPSP
jgi:hypothetical protein